MHLHRGDVFVHSFGREFGVPGAHGFENRAVLVQFPFGEVFQSRIRARAALDHEFQERPEHAREHLVVSGLGQ